MGTYRGSSFPDRDSEFSNRHLYGEMVIVELDVNIEELQWELFRKAVRVIDGLRPRPIAMADFRFVVFNGDSGKCYTLDGERIVDCPGSGRRHKHVGWKTYLSF